MNRAIAVVVAIALGGGLAAAGYWFGQRSAQHAAPDAAPAAAPEQKAIRCTRSRSSTSRADRRS